MSLRFEARIEIRDGNPYVLVSKTQATALQAGWKKPMPVLVRINGHPSPPWRINMMPAGDGSFCLYLHGDVRHPMPEWFRQPLEADARAKAVWDNLPPSRQKEVLRYFSRLQSNEAIGRNLQKIMQALSGKETRFLARTWKDGK